MCLDEDAFQTVINLLHEERGTTTITKTISLLCRRILHSLSPGSQGPTRLKKGIQIGIPRFEGNLLSGGPGSSCYGGSSFDAVKTPGLDKPGFVLVLFVCMCVLYHLPTSVNRLWMLNESLPEKVLISLALRETDQRRRTSRLDSQYNHIIT